MWFVICAPLERTSRKMGWSIHVLHVLYDRFIYGYVSIGGTPNPEQVGLVWYLKYQNNRPWGYHTTILSKDNHVTCAFHESSASTIWIGPSQGRKGLLRIFEVASAGEDRYVAKGAAFWRMVSEDEKVSLLTTNNQMGIQKVKKSFWFQKNLDGMYCTLVELDLMVSILIIISAHQSDHNWYCVARRTVPLAGGVVTIA